MYYNIIVIQKQRKHFEPAHLSAYFPVDVIGDH